MRKIGRSRARIGNKGDEPYQYALGDLADIHLGSDVKDVTGRHRPADIVNLSKLDSGIIRVTWSGGCYSMKKEQVRPHYSQAFFNYYGSVEISPLWQLMDLVEKTVVLHEPHPRWLCARKDFVNSHYRCQEVSGGFPESQGSCAEYQFGCWWSLGGLRL